MKKANDDYKITELCTVFNAKLSTYYYQQQTKIIKLEMIQLIAAIKAIATETNNSYGRRMNEELQLRDFKLGIYKTASLMKQTGIVTINPKKKHYYPDSGEVHDKAPNVLKRQFNPDTINTHWVGELKLVEIIDNRLEADEQNEISMGEAVKGMILNGLGFSNRPLMQSVF